MSCNYFLFAQQIDMTLSNMHIAKYLSNMMIIADGRMKRLWFDQNNYSFSLPMAMKQLKQNQNF